jgi:hypothetical protein
MPPKELPPSTKVRVGKMIVLPSRSECVVPVQCAAPGLPFLQAWLRDNATGVHMANGVAEIFPTQPFTVRVVNTSLKIRRLPKGMVLGHALPHPTAMVALIEDTDVSEDPTDGDNERTRKELSPMEYGKGPAAVTRPPRCRGGYLEGGRTTGPLANGRSCRDTRHASKTSLDVEWETRSGAFDSTPN